MSELRCEDGNALAADPSFNDPYGEKNVGACERCQGEGCDAKFCREAGHALRAFNDLAERMRQAERDLDVAWKILPDAARDYVEGNIGAYDLPTRELQCTIAFMQGRLAALDEGSKARSPYLRPAFFPDRPDYVPTENKREHGAWLAGLMIDDENGAAMRQIAETL